MSRRNSIVDAYGTIERKIRDTMDELSKLWDQIDMSDAMRVNRVDKAFKHIVGLCDDMITGEQQMVVNVENTIRENMEKVTKYLYELEMESFTRPPDIKDHSLALMRHLKSEVVRLEVEYNERVEQQKELVEKIAKLKFRLDSDFEFDHNPEILFPRVANQKYEDECERMAELLSQRFNTTEHLQSDMKRWSQLCGQVTDYVKEDPVLQEMIVKNIDDDMFVFSESVVTSYEQYHAEMKPIYECWLEDMEFKWLEKYGELCDLWDKCMVDECDRLFAARFEPGRHTDKHMNDMNNECIRLTEKFEACKSILNIVENWKSFWNETIEIENRRKQPKYYKKTDVLPDNKRERELTNLMAKAEKKMAHEYAVYENNQENDPFLINGMTPNEYVKSIKEEHKQELKYELQLKKEERTRLNSPQPSEKSLKRPMHPFKTPKSAKVEPSAKRLHFDPVLPTCYSPVTSDAISFITPVRQRGGGPMTSSPKSSRTPSRTTYRTTSRTTTPMQDRVMTPSSLTSSTSKRPLTRRNL